MGGKKKEEREARKEKAISPTVKLSLFLAEKAVAFSPSLLLIPSLIWLVERGRAMYVGKHFWLEEARLESSVVEGKKERAYGHVCPKGQALTATKTICWTFLLEGWNEMHMQMQNASRRKKRRKWSLFHPVHPSHTRLCSWRLLWNVL